MRDEMVDFPKFGHKYASLATLNGVVISGIQSNSQSMKCIIGLITKPFNALL